MVVAEFFKSRLLATEPLQNPRKLKVWASPRRRSINTAQFFPDSVVVQQRSNLVEIYMGECDRLTEDQIKV